MNRILLIITAVFCGWIVNSCTSDPEISDAELPVDSDSETLSISFTGDVLFDRGTRKVIERTDAESVFVHVKNLLGQSDFVVANLECPATKIVAPVNKQYIFRAEPEWLKAVKNAGITHLNMANNHSNDQGRTGMISTMENIQKNEMISLGAAKDVKEACDPVLIQKDKVIVALFSSVVVPLENWEYLEGRPGVCQNSPVELAKEIAEYKRNHPHHKVIVNVHWGMEYSFVPMNSQRIGAKMLIKSGADAIIGHHPHVVQTVQFFMDKPIFYSLGNFVFDQSREGTNQTMMVRLSWDKNGEMKVHYAPIVIEHCVPKPMQESQKATFIDFLREISSNVHFESGDGFQQISYHK